MEQQVTGLPGIVAKLIIIWDKALGAFVTVTEVPISEGCGITAYQGNITVAGEALITNLSQMIFNLVGYLTTYFGALAATGA